MSRKKNESATQEPRLSKFDLERAQQGLPPETKADKFQRLANRRVPRAIKALKSVEQLANSASYDWTDAQSQEIMDALYGMLTRVKDRFAGNKDNGVHFRI